MTVRFLLFNGKLDNEGVFGILESEQAIIVFSIGKDYIKNDNCFYTVGKNYILEKKKQIYIVISNSNRLSLGLLDVFCKDFGIKIPIYTSFYTKILINFYFPKLKNEIIIVEEDKDLKLLDFTINFINLSSTFIGSLGVSYSIDDNTILFIDNVHLNGYIENSLFIKNNFLNNITDFVKKSRKHIYLVNNFRNLRTNNDNSIFLAKNYLPNLLPIKKTNNKTEENVDLKNSSLFIFYEYDLYHITELLELLKQNKNKINIVNTNFFNLLSRVYNASNVNLKKIFQLYNKKSCKNERELFLLTCNNVTDPVEEIKLNLNNNFTEEQKKNLEYIVCLPPSTGEEVKIANVIDYLYFYSEKIINLGKNKSDFLKLGNSFKDIQTIIKIIKPIYTIILNNSYKNEKILNFISTKTISINNNHYWDFSNKNLVSLNTKKTIISLEETLIKQKEQLQQTGTFIIFLILNVVNENIVIKKITIQNIAVSPIIDLEKLKNKIYKWGKTKLTSFLNTKNTDIKIIKKALEKRLNYLVSSYINMEYRLFIENSIILLFIQ